MPFYDSGQQFFVHEHNLYITGGDGNRVVSAKCFVVHLLSKDVEQINSFDQPRRLHTLCHNQHELSAFIVGGKNKNGELKECIEFDF
jgi:hypothetical protein